MKAFLRGGLPLVLAICLTTSVTIALTPKERAIVVKALDDQNAAIAHDAERTKEIESAKTETWNANEAAKLAAGSAQTAGERAVKAEKQAKEQHDQLVTCETQNVEYRKIVDQVSGPWWFPGFNALIYGIKKCALSFLVIVGIVIVIGILITVFVPAARPVLKIVGAFFKRLGPWALSLLRRLKPKPKN